MGHTLSCILNSFQEIAKLALGFLFPERLLRLHSNRLPFPQEPLPVLPAPPSLRPPLSSVWVGTGIRVSPGPRMLFPGLSRLRDPFAPPGPCPRLFKCPDLMTGPGFPPLSFSLPPIKREN